MNDMLTEALALIDKTATAVDQAINQAEDTDLILATTASAVFSILKIQTLIIAMVQEVAKEREA